MSEKKNSYGRILKTSTLLGGSSVINVVLGMLRTKVLAVQLGPAMFGVMGLYTSLTTMISGITSLGLGQSAVRDIAAAAGSKDEQRIARTIRVFRRMVWVTGLMGLLTTLFLAYPASVWTFGNRDHVWAVAGLSLLVLFVQIQAGQIAVLQGLRRIGDIMGCNIAGAVCGTVLGVPLLLWLREHGIVPFMLAVAGSQMAASWWYARRVEIRPLQISWRETLTQSRDMISMGLTFVAAGLGLSGSEYIIRMTIRHGINEAAVGFYQSAFTISSIYVGFILHGMAGDFYPRLAGVADDLEKRSQLVSEQAEMAILLGVPGLVASLVFSETLIWLLYSSRFVGASEVLRWHVLGLLGRLVGWPLGFVLLARGDKYTFLCLEIATAVVHVCFVIVGVKWFGIAGAGAAFAAMYAFYVALICWVVKRRHGYTWPSHSRGLVVYGACAVAFAFATTFMPGAPWRFTCGGIVLAVTVVMSLRGLLSRLGPERIAQVQRFFQRRLRPCGV